MTAYIPAGVIFVAIVMIFVGIEHVLRPASQDLDQRLERYGTRRHGASEGEGHQSRNSPLARAVTHTVERYTRGKSFTASLQTELARADLKLTAAEYLVLQGLCVLGVGLLATIISGTPAAALAFGVLGFFLPRFWVKRRQAARLKAFNNQLADTITLLANSLRAGLSLVQAMDLVTREGQPPISTEFARVVREIGLGLSPEAALNNLVRRIRSDDLELMVTAILVQHEVGGNLSKILDTIAFTIRQRVKIKGEIRSLTAQGRMSGYLLAIMPVGVAGILFLTNPNHIMKLFTPGPLLLLTIATACSVFVGFTIIQKIVDIEV